MTTIIDPGALLNDVAAVIVSVGIIAMFLWKVIAKPHVTRFVQSVERVEHAVTANGHQDPDNPTMLDEFATVHANQRRIEAKLDAHIRWSDTQVARLDKLEKGDTP